MENLNEIILKNKCNWEVIYQKLNDLKNLYEPDIIQEEGELNGF